MGKVMASGVTEIDREVNRQNYQKAVEKYMSRKRKEQVVELRHKLKAKKKKLKKKKGFAKAYKSLEKSFADKKKRKIKTKIRKLKIKRIEQVKSRMFEKINISNNFFGDKHE